LWWPAAAMAARGAMWNQSIFSKGGMIPIRENLMQLLPRKIFGVSQ